MSAPKPRAAVAAMTPYVPGEQSPNPNLIKLNTNENPYPPSPKVLEAVRALGDANFAKYPNPTSQPLREAIAADLDIPNAKQVVVSNGSDEILKMFAEVFVDPAEQVGYMWPTYSLYPIFVAKADGQEILFHWKEGVTSQEAALEAAPVDLKLAYITNPNPPIGYTLSLETIRDFAAKRPETMVVVDEAYIAYGGVSAISLVREGIENIAVTRTFSKSHSLAGARVGFSVSSLEVADLLDRVRDSYNLDAASQAAALAAWRDADYTNTRVAQIIKTRARLTLELRELGFAVSESSGNFIFARHARARELFMFLREHEIMVRYFDKPGLDDGLRISIGTDEQIDALLQVLSEVKKGDLVKDF